MYAFAINIVDSSIDNKFCKALDANGAEGKCKKGDSNSDGPGLSKAFEKAAAASTEKVDAHTSKTIATDTAALSREEKGTIASVFAKV